MSRSTRVVCLLTVLLAVAASPLLASGGEAGLESVWGLPPLAWRIFNFLLFFGVLVLLLRKPLGQLFRSRREGIAEQLAEAARQRQEAERLQEAMTSRVASLEAEIGALRARLRQEGEGERLALERLGEEETARFLAQVEGEASRRVASARALLAQEAAETAVALARELLARELTPADRERLFRQTLDRLQAPGGQA